MIKIVILKGIDGMAFYHSRQAVVNRSGSKIPVYGKRGHSVAHTGAITVAGEPIGTIYPNEFYTVIPDPDSMYITSFEIVFRDPNGNQKHGYLETLPATTYDEYAWAAYQEPYHYYNSNGSTLVAAEKQVISGKTYYIFTVHGSGRLYMNASGNYQGTLPVGTKLATSGSTTGVTHGGYMLFNKKKLPGESWESLIPNATYGFVDLGLTVGSFPSNRPIR